MNIETTPEVRAIITKNNISVLVMVDNFGKESCAMLIKNKNTKAMTKRSDVMTLKLVLFRTNFPKTVDAPQKKAAIKASETPIRLRLKTSSGYVFGIRVGNEIRYAPKIAITAQSQNRELKRSLRNAPARA